MTTWEDDPDGVRLGAAGRLAVRLRQLRRARGLSQRALVGPLFLGAHSTVADYEAGRRIPPADVLRGYERYFALPTGQLTRLRELAVAERAEHESEARSLRPRHSGPSLVPRQLPKAPTLFTGRDDEAEHLGAVLTGRAATAVHINGMAGVGKTALAVWVAHRHADRFPDGVLYANLRAHDQSTEPVESVAVLGGFLRALGIGGDHLPFGVDERAALFRTVVADRSLLVLLDNVRDAEQVRPLLPGTPTSRTIITSRSRLTGLVVRDDVVDLPLGTLAKDGAAQLLRAILQLSGEQGGDRLEELAQLCGYLPLALRVAAQRTRNVALGSGSRSAAVEPAIFALDEMVAGLSDPRTRLDVLDVEDDASSALRHVLWWSYRSLSPAEQRMLRLLGLLDGPDVDVAAAAELTGSSRAQARRRLEGLVAEHLADEHRGRYTMHDLVRLFARERTEAEDGAPARSAAVGAYAGRLLHSAARARITVSPHLPPLRLDAPVPAIRPPVFRSADAALRWCEDELANLVAAVHTAYRSGLYATAWHLPTALYGFFDLRKYWSDWIETHETALAAATELGDLDAQGRVLCNLGNAYQPQYQFDAAIECYERALEIFRQIGWRTGQGKVLSNLGLVYEHVGDTERAIDHQESAVEIFREVGDDYGAALSLTNLGLVYAERSRLDEAISVHEQALALFVQSSDVEGQGRALANLGKALARAGRYAEARPPLERSVELLHRAGNRIDEAYALGDLLVVHYGLGEFAEAVNRGESARALFADIGHRAALAYLLDQLAVTYAAAGDENMARRCRDDAAGERALVTDAQLAAAARAAAPMAWPPGT
jgi:tetratricopeptide (TPR) repeat protein/transcriptional regulator with XRE-family HTH domain